MVGSSTVCRYSTRNGNFVYGKGSNWIGKSNTEAAERCRNDATNMTQ